MPLDHVEPPPADAGAVSAVFAAAQGGGDSAALFATLYRELHRMARHLLHANGPGATLSATTLLHEAWLNLHQRGVVLPDRPRFLAYAARAMRGLVIDYVRERRALKRGGGFHLTTLDTLTAESLPQADELDAIGEALDQLAGAEPALAELVELKFFCGFDFTEIAAMRGVSERTVQREWRRARLILYRSLREDDPAGPVADGSAMSRGEQ